VSTITNFFLDVYLSCLADPADVMQALSNVDDSKSSGDELDSKEEAYSRSGTDDAAERASDSTRDELSEPDVDTGTVSELKNLDYEDATPVPMPRRRRGGASMKKMDEMKPEKQKKPAPKRHREKGTKKRARLGIVDLVIVF